MEFLQTIAQMDSLSLLITFIGIMVIINFLPNFVKKMNITKLGSIEIEREQKYQSQNYEINRQIANIDIENRENLWDMTEDIFYVASESSKIGCEAIVGYILNGVASPLRNMIMLNHIASKLVLAEEEHLKAKIQRGIARSLKDSKKVEYGVGCPIEQKTIEKLSPEKYNLLIEDWILRARQITARACNEKIKVYEKALDNSTDKFWKNVYQTCIDKNKSYIRGLGYEK